MRLVEDYRRNAKDCRDLAVRMPPQHRKQLMEMAAQWDQLARDREGSVGPRPGNDHL